MILYVVGGSCYVKTNDLFILGVQDFRRYISGYRFSCAVITEKVSVDDFLWVLSRVILSPPKHLTSLRVLSKAVVATKDGIEFGKCFPVEYTSGDELKRNFEEYWSRLATYKVVLFHRPN